MTANTPAGWYQAETDPPGTERYWDGATWTAQQRQSGTPFSMGDQSSYAGGYSSHGIESNLAGIGNRIAARLLDCIVWFILGIPGGILSFWLFNDDNVDAAITEDRLPFGSAIGQFMLALLQLALVVGYEAIMNSKFNNTIGKKVTSTKIVKLDGSEPSLADQITRFAPYITLGLLSNILFFLPRTPIIVFGLSIGVSLLYLVIGVVAIIMVATSDNEQALWDKISKTTVVRDITR